MFEMMYPQRYSHIWLGFPDDDAQGRKVLPYRLVELCVKAWEYRPKDTALNKYAGVDVSGEGSDNNALIIRQGPNILFAKKWGTIDKRDLAEYADEYCVKNGVKRLHYDQGGGGDALQVAFKDMVVRRPYGINGIQFGSAVTSPKLHYMIGKKNKDMFLNRSSQMSWALHNRAYRTERLMNGEAIDPNTCLFINPELSLLADYKAELSQPEYHEQQTSRIQIEKSPDDTPSPDLYDATVLAFADDSESGLVQI